MLCLLEDILFPEEDIAEEDMQQNLLHSNETLNKNLSLDINSKLGEALKIRKK